MNDSEHLTRADRISHLSKSPLYQQIYALLRTQIVGGQWHPGDMLPSEASLVERYQVSRATVRQALDELVSDGLIFRRQGRGTFVALPNVEQGLVRIVSFTEDMQQRGLVPGTRLISASLLPAPPAIAKRLEIPENEPLAYIERLRLADGEPLSMERSYLIHRYCPGILEQDYTAQSLRKMLTDQYGVHIASARQTIQAITAHESLAVALDIPTGAPLLFIERVSYSEFNVPVEYLLLYHRWDRYTLHNELRG